MATESTMMPETAVAQIGIPPAALRRAWAWDELLRERDAARAQACSLAEANRQMHEFLGIATHELRSPVTGSLLSVALATRQTHELMHQAATGDNALDAAAASQLAAVHRLLTRAEQSLDRLTRLLVDLLDTSRVHAGQLKLQVALCDLTTIVRETVEEQRQIAVARTIRLHVQGGASAPVVADVDRIRQVVTNYLTNALRYSPAERPVEVGVQVQCGWARVAVRDEGPGLSRAEQQRVWERYHRAAVVQVMSGPDTGLGLGLYLCKTIIEQHHGLVGVQSTPGKGSTFWFALAVAGTAGSA